VNDTGQRSVVPRVVDQINASRSAAGYGSDRNSTPFTAVNAEVVSAKATARVTMAVAVSVGVRRAPRHA
jgi:hypothetical protein